MPSYDAQCYTIHWKRISKRFQTSEKYLVVPYQMLNLMRKPKSRFIISSGKRKKWCWSPILFVNGFGSDLVVGEGRKKTRWCQVNHCGRTIDIPVKGPSRHPRPKADQEQQRSHFLSTCATHSYRWLTGSHGKVPLQNHRHLLNKWGIKLERLRKVIPVFKQDNHTFSTSEGLYLGSSQGVLLSLEQCECPTR